MYGINTNQTIPEVTYRRYLLLIILCQRGPDSNFQQKFYKQEKCLYTTNYINKVPISLELTHMLLKQDGLFAHHPLSTEVNPSTTSQTYLPYLQVIEGNTRKAMTNETWCHSSKNKVLFQSPRDAVTLYATGSSKATDLEIKEYLKKTSVTLQHHTQLKISTLKEPEETHSLVKLLLKS